MAINKGQGLTREARSKLRKEKYRSHGLVVAGQQFFRLFVVRKLKGSDRYLCQCDCGKKCVSLGGDLRREAKKSCGCYNKEAAKARLTRHGMSRTVIYSTWKSMMHRCYMRTHKHYKDYGGRGITVCIRWQKSFLSFYRDMGNKSTNKHSLERKNNNGNYTPKNCCWATQKEQMNNRRISIH